MKKAIEIISREHQTHQTVNLGNGANSSLKLAEPSIVQMQASPADIMSYERVGDDLVLHMKDGSTVDYSEFFTKDAAGKHSELVLNEAGKQPTHVAFDEAAMADASAQGGATELSAEFESLTSTDSLLSSNATAGAAGGTSLGALAGIGLAAAAVVGAGAAVVAHNNKDDDDHDHGSNADAADIVVNPITGDNVVDATEAANGITVDGTSSAPGAGCEVVVKVGGMEFKTVTDENGDWSVDVPAEAWSAQGGATEIVVVMTNETGEVTEIKHPLEIDGPLIAVNPIAGDDIVTTSEAASGVTVDGYTTPGSDVVVTVGDKEFTTTAGDDGKWSVEVTPEALESASGEDLISVKVTDPNGDVTANDYPVIIDAADVKISIDPIAGDDAINMRDAAAGVTISGGSSAQGAGCDIVVKVGGKDYETTTDENGNWSVNVPKGAWSGIEGDAEIVVIMTNESGTTGAVKRIVSVDTTALEVKVDPITGDDVIDSADVLNGIAVNGTSSAGAGQEVVVKVGNKEFSTFTDENGDWSADIPAEAFSVLDGKTDIVVTTVDESGNVTEVDHPVDIHGPLIAIDPIAGDDIVTTREAAEGVTIDGYTTPGADVVVTVGGKEFTTTAGSNGKWAVKVPPAALEAASKDDLVTVEVTNSDGETSAIDHHVIIDAADVKINVDPVAGDNAVNAKEAEAGVVIRGSSSATSAGCEIVVKIDGKDYRTTTDENGNWSVSVPERAWNDIEGETEVVVVMTNVNGITGAVKHIVTVGTTEPFLSVDVAGDDVLNALEVKNGATISGVATAGSTIAVKLGGEELVAIADENGKWSLNVEPEALASIADGDTIQVSATDEVGNTTIIDHRVAVDTGVPGLVIDPLDGGNILDIDNITDALTISGKATGLSGDEILEVTLNGKQYAGTIAEDGTWSLDIPEKDLLALELGNKEVTVSISDAAGNSTVETIDLALKTFVKGSEDFTDSSMPDAVKIDESYTFDSGLTLTGIENGWDSGEREERVFDIVEGRLSVGWDAIGDISFGEKIDKLSFNYQNVNNDAYVYVYDDNGNVIHEERLKDGGDSGSSGPFDFSYETSDGVKIDHIRIDTRDEYAGFSIDDFQWGYYSSEPAVQNHLMAVNPVEYDSGSLSEVAVDDNSVTGLEGNNHFTFGHGGGDLLTYHVLNAADATGGNGVDRISGFTIGNGDDADRIDLHELLADSGYRGASEGTADAEALADFIKVTVKGNDTEIAIDRDGSARSHELATVVTLSDVQTDLATLLANHQLIV
ncbi:BapA/Bap/LapF family prefix-like domain-containing protein [Marinobacter sp.]|uniref:BapA/Bap/LapF family prefix-like domain-containing protein n=1 Tax=Marinobacter sp. TaxID=50741 RepID=UPI003A8D52CD